MRSSDCSYYFLSSTAIGIWQNDDQEGQKNMFACLSAIYKDPWFHRVIFKSSEIPNDVLKDLAENVFLATWEKFNENGKAGKLQFDKPEYTSYLFTAFKGNYLKALQKELKQAKAEQEFGSRQTAGNTYPEEAFFSDRTRKALDQLSPDCRQLLIWKHIEGLSHDEIALRKNVQRSSSIKMVSRCGRRFIELWRTKTNLTQA